MVLERLFIGDTRKETSIHLFSDLLGGRALRQYDSFTWKTVLKRLFSWETELQVNMIVLRWT